ncbi:hypothetical protein AGMMS49982_17210 [Bacteroidia bacterium]|nr:hypothetical protein AGMMS49982_17210 [Bacteroidia bacterium]
MLTIDKTVTITTKVVGAATAKVTLIKNRTETVLEAAAPVTNNLCTVTLNVADLGLAKKGDVATVWVDADGFHDTRTLTMVEPEWNWTAVNGSPYSTTENSTVVNKVTFTLDAPWLTIPDSLKLTNVSGIVVTGTPTIEAGKVVIKGTFTASETFAGGDDDKKKITIEASYTVDTIRKATNKYEFARNVTQDTYTKSASYSFTDANAVGIANPDWWDATDKGKTFYGLYDGKEYVGYAAATTGDGANQPVLYLYGKRIYNVHAGTTAYKMEFFPFGVGKPGHADKPGGKDLTDRGRATLLIGVTGPSTPYADFSSDDLEHYYYVKIGSSTEPTYVGTLRLTRTLLGTVELSFKYDVRRNALVE